MISTALIFALDSRAMKKSSIKVFEGQEYESIDVIIFLKSAYLFLIVFVVVICSKAFSKVVYVGKETIVYNNFIFRTDKIECKWDIVW